MKYYKATNFGFSDPIEKIEIEKESESSIWINGRKTAKESSYSNHFPSFDEAKQWLIDQKRKECDKYKEQFERSLAILKKYSELKEK